ncbi:MULTISPECIES: TraR/DksA family transcriptional regulator [unclassified Nitratiruptor]|uniref:TraR/DksA family transcriptional regulator n=1 Tax=unclassified Nitratiruptor TaxID=2624044 RepID=UPI001915BE3C|nr:MULTISPECIES: TraR/DksA family transcriptional regulator [unclassified Nitratiruptor]BCD60206.1 DnaK suppressor protein [Nitratiruptor sp. YY08-10]BCD64305.1 DnaK suppressor protein [Nitratiruptor sp. YY08-14]
MTQEQLEHFKKILQERLDRVQKEIDALLNELEEVGTFENIDDIEDLAQLETINDTDKALLQKLNEEKKQILSALRKIENGTYGQCSDGSTIPLEKLEADPLYEC